MRLTIRCGAARIESSQDSFLETVMKDSDQHRTPLYFLARELGELRNEIEKLQRGRARDREDIATLLKQNRSLRSTVTRLQKRVFAEPSRTLSHPQAPPKPDPSPPPTKSEPGPGGIPDFAAPLSELTGTHRV